MLSLSRGGPENNDWRPCTKEALLMPAPSGNHTSQTGERLVLPAMG